MAGPERLVVLVNPQFRRLSDFSPLGGQRARAQKAFFDANFEVAYGFEEFGCRGEDVKLVGSRTVGWRAFVFLDDKDSRGTPLFEGKTLPERPEYTELEKEINRAHPSPRAQQRRQRPQRHARVVAGQLARELARDDPPTLAPTLPRLPTDPSRRAPARRKLM